MPAITQVSIEPSARKATYNPVVPSVGPFDFPWPLFDGSGVDLAVTVDGVVVPQVGGWTFTATPPEQSFPGSVNTWTDARITFLTPRSGSIVIKGRRVPRREGARQFVEGRGTPARFQNSAHNEHTATLQELYRDTLDLSARTFQVKDGQTVAPIDIAQFYGKRIGVDPSGTLVPVSPNLLPDAINAINILDSTPSGRAMLVASSVAAQALLLNVGHMPELWGAVPGGNIADAATNRAAIVAGLSHLAARGGGTLDFQGKNYYTDTYIEVPANCEIANGKVFPSVANQTVFTVTGVEGAPINIDTSVNPAPVRAQDYVWLPVGHGLAKGDMVWVYSDDYWSKQTSAGIAGAINYCKNGEWQKVRNAGSNFVEFYGRLTRSMLTAPKIRKYVIKRGVSFRNFEFAGQGVTQTQTGIQGIAASFSCWNVSSSGMGYGLGKIIRCRESNIFGGHCTNTDMADGYPYGWAFANGCEHMTIAGVTGDNLKHLISIGDADGQDQYYTITGCTARHCSDAGFDTHSGRNIHFTNCHVDGGVSQQGAPFQNAGFTIASAKTTLTNCTVQNVFGPALIAQLISNEEEDYFIVKGMMANDCYGVNSYVGGVENGKFGGSLQRVELDISGQSIDYSTSNGLQVRQHGGGLAVPMRGLHVSGRILAQQLALDIAPSLLSSPAIEEIRVVGEYVRANQAGAAVQIAGLAAGQIQFCRIDATIIGGNIGLNHPFNAANIAGSRVAGWSVQALSNAGDIPVAIRDVCILTA